MANKQEIPTISNITPEDGLRLRVLQVKSKLPMGIMYTVYYEQVFGEKTKKELDHIRSVWNLRLTDEAITANLEKMVEHIKAS